MLGGFTALAGAYRFGARLGKFRPDGTPNPLPGHNVPLYMLGTLFLVFGWFGFNTGSTLAGNDPNCARIAVNTTLASAAGGMASLFYIWARYRKPDPSFLCNGILAGLVSITAPCAYVAPWAAVLIGSAAGVLVVWSCFFIERVLFLDDPVGAISVHGTCGLWGVLALGLFADGTYGLDLNGVPGKVSGLFYGDSSQFLAQFVGTVVNLLWVLPVASVFFWATGWWVGNRVSAQAELSGLDVPELGAVAYINQDLKAPETRMVFHSLPEPRSAEVPPNGQHRFSILVEGVEGAVLAQIWSDLCQVGDSPPPADFLVVYPFMTTFQGTRFRFRGGDPLAVRGSLERLLQIRLAGRSIRVRLEG